MQEILFYKTHPHAYLPTFGTEGAACFDFYASLVEDHPVTIYNKGVKMPHTAFVINNKITINAYDRALVPVNLIMDIPAGHSVRVHPRSGISLKQGLTLFNCTGVIDEDYVDPMYITIYNISGVPQVISDGDRIAQANLQDKISTKLSLTNIKPATKTSRLGGFGSTGKN